MDPTFGKNARELKSVNQIGTKMKFHQVPHEVMMYAWATFGDKWAHKIAEFCHQEMKSKKLSKGIRLLRYDVNFSWLRKPEPNSDDPNEKDYQSWYEKQQKNGRVDFPPNALILPRVKALCFLASDSRFERATIRITTPKNKSDNKDFESIGYQESTSKNKIEYSCAVFYDTDLPLSDGLYTITISNIEGFGGMKPSCWSKALCDGKGYVLRENVQFSIRNAMGEFEIVVCDPISVEEALMQQFPVHFAQLTSTARRKTDRPFIDPVNEDKLYQPLAGWAERLGWLNARAKMGVGLLKADGFRSRAHIMGAAVAKMVKTKDPALESMKECLEFYFGVHQNSANWKKFLDKEIRGKGAKFAKVADLGDFKGAWGAGGWKKRLSKDLLAKQGVELLDMDMGDEEKTRRLLGLEKQHRFSESLKNSESAKKGVKQLLKVADVAKDGLELAKALNEVSWASDALKDNLEKLDTALDEYRKQDGFDSQPSRYAFAMLERLRSATVYNKLELAEATDELMNAVFDTVFGVLELMPATAAAARFVVLLKDSADLVMEAAGAWLEAMVHFDILLSSSEIKDLWASLQKARRANMEQLPQIDDQQGGKDNVALQLRLRAEALYGLMLLLTRACVVEDKKETEAAYLKRVQNKYDIEGYIETFILRDGWQISPSSPGLDEHWLRARSEHGSCAELEDYQTFYGPDADLGELDNDLVTYCGHNRKLVKGNLRANFQRYFPIHRREAQDIRDLARTFTVTPSWLKKEDIEYTCVYTRGRKSKKPLNRGWSPINPKAYKSTHDLTSVDVTTPLRVLVVLKDSVPAGLYSASLQIHRRDDPVSGPVEKTLIGRLDDELMTSEEDWKGRLGCVFFPNFQFGAVSYRGTKPLLDSISTGSAAGDFREGLLSNMLYGFELKVGGEKTKQRLRLGPNSELTEYKVSLRESSEGHFLDRNFLLDYAKVVEYPTLFSVGGGLVACWVRVGGATGKWKCAKTSRRKHGNQLSRKDEISLDDFDWTQPVEFMLALTGRSPREDAYAKVDQDWQRIPIFLDLFHNSRRGPNYRSTLYHLGTMHMSGRTCSNFEPHQQHLKQEPIFAPLTNLFTSSPSHEQSWELTDIYDDMKHLSLLESGSYDCELFAAHFRLHYTSPAGIAIDSMRPFCAQDDWKSIYGNKTLNYRLKNIHLPKNTGVKKTDIPTTLQVRGPENTSTGPWAEPKISNERLSKWLSSEASHIHPLSL